MAYWIFNIFSPGHSVLSGDEWQKRRHFYKIINNHRINLNVKNLLKQ